MKRKSKGHEGHGPSQRQLRAAELVRHALVEIVQREELRDPDLKHMTAFVSSLGPGDPQLIANGLTRISSFLRGRLARSVDLKFTPELHFQPDVSYDEARHIDELLASPEVARDLKPHDEEGER